MASQGRPPGKPLRVPGTAFATRTAVFHFLRAPFQARLEHSAPQPGPAFPAPGRSAGAPDCTWSTGRCAGSLPADAELCQFAGDRSRARDRTFARPRWARCDARRGSRCRPRYGARPRRRGGRRLSPRRVYEPDLSLRGRRGVPLERRGAGAPRPLCFPRRAWGSRSEPSPRREDPCPPCSG